MQLGQPFPLGPTERKDETQRKHEDQPLPAAGEQRAIGGPHRRGRLEEELRRPRRPLVALQVCREDARGRPQPGEGVFVAQAGVHATSAGGGDLQRIATVRHWLRRRSFKLPRASPRTVDGLREVGWGWRSGSQGAVRLASTFIDRLVPTTSAPGIVNRLVPTTGMGKVSSFAAAVIYPTH